MKKVAIVTVYNACNYGSFLQAYSLNLFLKQHYKVAFVRMTVDTDKIIGKGSFPKDYIEYEEKKYCKIKNNQSIFDIVDSVDKSYACAVIGSDTVWNLFDPAYSNVPYFLGDELGSNRIISYAASIGPNRLLKFLLMRGSKFVKVRKLDAFGVRDYKTEIMVRLLGKKPVRVLDPTFLVTLKGKAPDLTLPDKYILVYTYGFSQESIEAIKSYARANSLPIVATGSLCTWADINAVVDSFEWLWLIEHADYVITNTFHGTVFSIIFQKRFAALTQKAAKIESLLSEFELRDRMCTGRELETILKSQIDFNKVNQIKKVRIKQSQKFLLENIEGK